MPFPKNAKDNLAVAFSLANILTEDNGNYLPLYRQVLELNDVQKLVSWQIHHPFQWAHNSHNKIKQATLGYLSLDASFDLFIRYNGIPPFENQEQLAYLEQPVQKLIYNHFKDNILKNLLCFPHLPNLAQVDAKVQKLVKERVLGYSKKIEGQTEEDWQLFVAELDIGIAALSNRYKEMARALHPVFLDFRAGHLRFTQNYFDRCMLLARVEEWLARIAHHHSSTPVSNSRVTAFCDQLKALDHLHLETAVRDTFAALNELQTRRVTEVQYEQLVRALLSLKPKYDAYRSNQENLSVEQLLQTFMALYPRPVLASQRQQASQHWSSLRARHREKEEQERAKDTLGHRRGFTNQ